MIDDDLHEIRMVVTRWLLDGTELFFIAPDARLMAVAIADKTLDVGALLPLFRTRLASARAEKAE